MKRYYYFKGVFLVLITMLTLSTAYVYGAEESLTVTTYYPSPYGVYSEIRLYPKGNPSTAPSCQEGLMFYSDGSNASYSRGLYVCGSGGWQPLGGDYWAASPSNSANIYNTNLGNVGIGTTDPLGLKLFVNANNGVSNGMQIADPQGHYLSIGGGIDAMGHNSTGFHIGTVGGLAVGGIGGGIRYDYTTNDMGVYSTYDISISSNAASPPLGVGDIKFSTGGVERMRIVNSGNVGIATLAGSGNAYVCADSSGSLYRSGSPCI